MAVKDEFKKEREMIKEAPLGQKIKYIWDYYKVQILIIVGVIALIIGIIHGVTSKKEMVLGGIYLNYYDQETTYVSEELANGFMEAYQIDGKKQELHFVTDLSYKLTDDDIDEMSNSNTNQALVVYAESGTMDFVVGSREVMEELAYKNLFVDLSDALSAEDYASYEPYFIYFENNSNEQVPALIDMSKSEKLMKAYEGQADSAVMGIFINAPHVDKTMDFAEYLMNEN